MGNSESSPYIWQWQSNKNPWDSFERPLWDSYSKKVSDKIERAFLKKKKNRKIGEYTIDFTKKI